MFSDKNDTLVLPGDLSLEDISILEEGELDSLDDGDSDIVSYASAANRSVPVTEVVNPLVNRANGSSGNNANSNTTSAQNRRHPQPSSSSRDRAAANHRGNVRNNSSSHIRHKKSEFLVKNTRQVTVEEEGGAGIPFSALREHFRYKAFVTNLCPNTNIETIGRHIDSILQVNCTIKTVSPLGAPHLSLILMFTSESDTLDLKMTGLWPKGTIIEKCIPLNQRGKNGRRSNHGTMSREHYHQGPSNLQGSGPRSQANSSRNQEVNNSYVHATPDQIRLHQQWNPQ